MLTGTPPSWLTLTRSPISGLTSTDTTRGPPMAVSRNSSCGVLPDAVLKLKLCTGEFSDTV
jgi:hypothetical protein